ncbi:NADH-quinone oxidoreductase subunit C [Azospirillum sp. YIM B02556]|uniref:NADH-quinone oxidoreductase subunit C n=1 Tax=Azospirillum endophyticum TaxID=2800326 RepID=A0ABS1FC86_9PROT|nr:NADH-quinone oxidoreductase subunit C [Azospirillum endophyticum]MBK1841009.1 NADH-quinone oxidoreductase subunit C [Azospirillum endophyticum]
MKAELGSFIGRLQPGWIVECATDRYGVTVGWCVLEAAGDLLPFAAAVKEAGGRLSTITAYQPKDPDAAVREIAYHFDLDGDTLTATVRLPRRGAEIDSLTPLFRNADWNEREFMELYDIRVRNHPDPRRLFVDATVDPAVLDRLIPFSAMVNSASTKTLWERIMAKTGDEQ